MPARAAYTEETFTWQDYHAHGDNKGLPIVGEQPLPVKLRPDCVGCSVKLKPNVWTKFERFGEGRIGSFPAYREFDGTYGIDGYFHSKECAYRYALSIARRMMPARGKR